MYTYLFDHLLDWWLKGFFNKIPWICILVAQSLEDARRPISGILLFIAQLTPVN